MYEYTHTFNERWGEQFDLTEEVVLKLLKCIYGLNQAAMAFYGQILECTSICFAPSSAL